MKHVSRISIAVVTFLIGIAAFLLSPQVWYRSASPIKHDSVPSLSQDRHQISEITLQRSGSWGMKSGYKVVLRKDGTAEYKGDSDAERKGKYQGQIANDQFERLSRLVIKNDFLSLAGKYHALVTDSDTVITSVVYLGGRKTVEDYGRGGGEGLPEIQRAINQTAEQIVWRKMMVQ